MNNSSNKFADQPPIILVSPDMRPSVMGVARSLSEAALLRRFVTTLATKNGHGPTAFRYFPDSIRAKLNGQLKRREVPSFLDVPVDTVEFPELVNLAARRFGLGDVKRHHLWEWAERNFDRTVAKRWAGRVPCIYGCEHASVDTFRRQKESGGLNVLWQVIAHHKTMTELLTEERLMSPQVVTDYELLLEAAFPIINARKDQQYTDADLIVTNSEFCRQTFLAAGVDAAKVKAIPTGCPPVLADAAERRSNQKIIFLCAGSQSIRKGVPYLIEAWKTLRPSHAELWLVGQMQLPEAFVKDLPPSVVIKPPVDRDEMEVILRHASVLVLPTLAEGRSHIVLEALSAGLAIITTENSGCGDLIEDGVNGWKVAARDSAAIAEKISWCIDNARPVVEMQSQSQVKAAAWQESDFAVAHAAMLTDFLTTKGVEVAELEVVQS